MTSTENLRDLDRYQKRRRLVIALLVAALFGLYFTIQSWYPPETVMHEGIEMVGVVLIFLGIVGRLWCTLYIGGKKAAQIVDSGPYSICRNPLYFFSAVAAAGVGAQSGSFVTAILFFALCAIAFHFVILREERYLGANFGAPYADYLQRVPRFFPKPSLFKEGTVEGFKSKRLLNTLLDGLLFFVAMPVFEWIDHAQMAGTLPVLLRLP